MLVDLVYSYLHYYMVLTFGCSQSLHRALYDKEGRKEGYSSGSALGELFEGCWDGMGWDILSGK